MLADRDAHFHTSQHTDTISVLIARIGVYL